MRYATVPLSELQAILGLVPLELFEIDGWLAPGEPEAVADADGRPVEHAVFADTETGTVVLKDPNPAAGAHPLRVANRRPPLTVRLRGTP